MKIGARVLKSGLAVILSIYLSLYLIPDNSASLAAVAALTTTRPTVRTSYEMLLKRLGANTIGGIIAIIMLFTIGNNPVAIGIAAVLTIAVLNALNLSDVLLLACITVVAIMSYTGDNNYLLVATFRVLETFIGVMVAFCVNWLVYPPQHDKPFYALLVNLTNELLVFIRATLRKNVEFSVMHRDINWAQEQFNQLNTLFNLMRNEVIFSKKQRIITARRMVIYRQMVRTTRAVYNLLVIFHNSGDIFHSFPRELQIKTRERLETLMVGHEQIILKFSGRVSATEVNFIFSNKEYKEKYMKDFFAQAFDKIEDDNDYDVNSQGVIHIMSAIYYYEESLMKLNNIIRIYKQRYDENKEADELLGEEHF